MQLLLILSALLSALTGAIGGRMPEPRSHQTAFAQVAVRVAPARAGVVRPAATLPTPAEVADLAAVAVFVPARPVPLYASRRRV